MTALDQLKAKLKPDQSIPLPGKVKERIDRGRKQSHKNASLRRVCVKFWEGGAGNYYYVNEKGFVANQATVTYSNGGGKPPHRIRNAYDFIHSIVEGKVSAATQRVPGYDVTPTSVDPEVIAAADLSEQIAYYGYDKWRLRRATTKFVTDALVQREGFALPYFDQNVGPFTQDLDGTMVGQGEVKVRTFNRSEVYWEAGQDFDESRWHATETAMLISDIEQTPGYCGGSLKADADTRDLPTDKPSNPDMAVVTDYMERPCVKYPNGRRMLISNERVIVDYRLVDDTALTPWEPYPLFDADGNAVDEPALVRLSFTVNPNGDDTGMVEHLLDLARTINDCWNKLLEWKNRCLNPQMLAPKGSLVTRSDDVPGSIKYYNPMGQLKPEWEQPPQVPRELFEMLDLAITQMRAIAADVQPLPDPNLAAKTISAAIGASNERWQSFLGDLAEVHSHLMRRCLTLVARHYDRQRIIDIRGQQGWAPDQAFAKADLMSQVNVRVGVGSIETKSRQQIQSSVEFMQANYPGAIGPEDAWKAISDGTDDGLMRSYRLDEARANTVVQRLLAGPPAFDSFAPRMDTDLGAQVPGWMPRKQDNIDVWKRVVGDFTKTPLYDTLPVETQHIYELVYSGLEWLEQTRAMKQASLMQMQAQSQGMGNAAAPQTPPPPPDKAGFAPGTNQSPVPTP